MFTKPSKLAVSERTDAGRAMFWSLATASMLCGASLLSAKRALTSNVLRATAATALRHEVFAFAAAALMACIVGIGFIVRYVVETARARH